MRKLVTLRKILDISPIENADAIEVATVDGWKVVVKKGEFSVGMVVVYFEIDSVLPQGRPEFEFLMARGCKDQPVEDGSVVYGHRLRTIKLRGQVSQGLIIPLPSDCHLEIETKTLVPTVLFPCEVDVGIDGFLRLTLDDDLSALYGVKKYEKPTPAQLQGMVRGCYPGWLPKTDQERIQNCYRHIPTNMFEVEEKIEGSSMTIYHNGEEAGVTSRNLDLKMDQEGNTFVNVAKASGLFDALENFQLCRENTRIAIRGELIGPGIQENIYKLTNHKFHVYDIWIDDRYLTPSERREFIADFIVDFAETSVVQYARCLKVIDVLFEDVDEIIQSANGQSELAPVRREGLVFKSAELVRNNVFSFKAISPEYLLKEKE